MSESGAGARKLVSTGAAARAVSVDRTTLARWAAAGLVKPAGRTAGGHLRWDVDRLRTQLDELGDVAAGDGAIGPRP